MTSILELELKVILHGTWVFIIWKQYEVIAAGFIERKGEVEWIYNQY